MFSLPIALATLLAIGGSAAPLNHTAREIDGLYLSLSNHINRPFSFQLYNGASGAVNGQGGVLQPNQYHSFPILGPAQVIKVSANLNNPADTPFQFEYTYRSDLGIIDFDMSGKDGDPFQAYRRSMEILANTNGNCVRQACDAGEHDSRCEYTTDHDYDSKNGYCPVIYNRDAPQLRLYIGNEY